mgnify:CR=1 FL=1
MNRKTIISVILTFTICVQCLGITILPNSNIDAATINSTTKSMKKSEPEKVGENVYKYIEEYGNDKYKTVIYGKGVITEARFNVMGDLVIDEGITGIADGVFVSSSLKSVSLPDSLESIGKRAFKGCDYLEEITIPENVKQVGADVFADCSDLRKIVNNSSANIQAPRKIDVSYMGYKYYVNGKKASKVGTNEKMLGKAKKLKLDLVSNGGKVTGQKVTTHIYGTNPLLPKAKKKGFTFIGWSEKKNSSNGINKLWRDGKSQAKDQKRFAQYAKVSVSGKKKSIQIKCTNFNASELLVYYSTKKDHSDEESYGIYENNGKLQALTPKNTSSKERISLKGHTKHYKKDKSRNYVDVTIPNLKSNKKYYIRLKYWNIYGSEDDHTSYGNSRFFGKTTVRTK